MSFLGRLKTIALDLLSPDTLVRRRYAVFRELLKQDHRGHELMAKIERLYHDSGTADFSAVRFVYRDLLQAISSMVESLSILAPHRGAGLPDALQRIDLEALPHLAAANPDTSPPFVFALDELTENLEHLAGNKASNLAVLSKRLGLPVPTGLVITARAYHYFIEYNGLRPEIESRLAVLDIDSHSSLDETSSVLMNLLMQATFPRDLELAVMEYRDRLFEGERCAVRSSGIGEDGKISFAGQYRTVLNTATEGVMDACKEVYASRYSPTALSYRIRNGLLDEETPMAVLVMRMVDAEASGILYSKDPFGLQPDRMKIYSTWGVGEPLVEGAAAPDVTEISTDGSLRLLAMERAVRDRKSILSREKGTQSVPLEDGEKKGMSLDEEGARRLAGWAERLESFFGTPVDMEWCRDRRGELFILQCRPLRLDTFSINLELARAPRVPNRMLISKGEKASSGVAAGQVALVYSASDLGNVPEGAVLVAPGTSPAFARVIGRLRAVVTDVGSPAGHFASVAREWGVPALVNTGVATRVLNPGETVTVDADGGRVFAGVAEELLNSASRKSPPADSPFRKRLRRILDTVSPLNLVDPQSASFDPGCCRSLHDVLRYVHEKAVEEMFSLGGRGRRRFRGARKLASDIPVTFYVLDLADGLARESHRKKQIAVNDVKSFPFIALWEGLTCPGATWSQHVTHFDWDVFDRAATGGGIISFDSQSLASYALVSEDYLNIGIRFGYHFTVVDALCGFEERDNYISFRFEGGGADFEKRCLRVLFLAQVLQNHHFEVVSKQDWLTARAEKFSREEARDRLEIIGRLLAFTPFLDMTLDDLAEVGRLVAVFSQGQKGAGGIGEIDGAVPDRAGNSFRWAEPSTLPYRPTWITGDLCVGHAPMSFEELDSIRKQGIDAVMNLCAEYGDLHRIERDFGLDVYYFPIEDDGVPDLAEMEKALEWLDEAIYLGKKVLIHCRLGIGRTGTVVRSYLIRRGFGLDLAEERLKRIRSIPTSLSQWRLLRRYGSQAGRITIREPSLEGRRPVDLTPYFSEYEALVAQVDSVFEQAAAAHGGIPACGRDTDACCSRFFALQFIEAVYLRHQFNRALSREDRLAAVQRALEAGRIVEKTGESLPSPGETGGRSPGCRSVPAAEHAPIYRCPLNVEGKCILYAYRPLVCRVYGIIRPGEAGGSAGAHISFFHSPESFQMDQVNEELHGMSRRLFFALNGRFLEGKSLLFPIPRLISGKFAQDYFAVLSDMEKTERKE